MRHFAAPVPGTAVTRQRLVAVGTLAPPAPGLVPVTSLADEAVSASPTTSDPSAASISRLEAATPTGPLSATTPLTAPLRRASSIAHAMSPDRRSPETTSSLPGAIP